MKKTLLQNRAFLIPYILFVLVSGTFLLTYPKGEAHLILNQCYSSEYCDYFFSFATYFGDGFVVLLIIAIFLFIRYRFALLLAASNLVAAIITQTLKHTLFSDYVRPKKYFEGAAELKLIPWIENYSYNTFPSGHSTAAFATFICFALLI